MRSLLSFSGLLVGLILILSTGCEQDRCVRTEEYIQYQPVYKRLEEMRVPVTAEAPQALRHPGKIYYYGGYLFINEINEGIHIVDNHDPSNPVQVAFLNIPGNLDMAIKDHLLYVDNYLDLVALDLTSPTQPVEVGRVNDVFQSFYTYSDALGYEVAYEPTQVRQTIDCSSENWGRRWFYAGDFVLLNSNALAEINVSFDASSAIPGGAIGGSMARFTATGDYLYTIDGSEIKVFDVSGTQPDLRSQIQVQWGIETLFPMAGQLFIGSNNGLLIYSLDDPAQPSFRSNFQHASSCDPVFVSGDIAYVTLRSGTPCQGFTNQLDVLDVSDLDHPALIKSYPMSNPHGLSVVEPTLYLCEGESGIKTFDVSDVHAIDQHLLDQVTGFNAYDVIVLPPGNLVMVIGEDGLHQFDATDKGNLTVLSVMPIEK